MFTHDCGYRETRIPNLGVTVRRPGRFVKFYSYTPRIGEFLQASQWEIQSDILVEQAVEVGDDKLPAENEALEELQAEDPVRAQIVKMKFFMGMQDAEIAASLDISEKSVQRPWIFAKAWLYQRIRSAPCSRVDGQALSPSR